MTAWVAERAITNRMEAFLLLEKILRDSAGGVLKSASAKDSVYALGTEHPSIADVYITLVAHYSPRPRYAYNTIFIRISCSFDCL